MDDVRSGHIYALLFIMFIGLLSIGGFFLTKMLTKNDQTENPKKEENKSIVTNLKVNKDEEYLYFTNNETLSIEHDITYQDIKININSDDAKKIETKLNNEMAELKGSVKKISEEELTEEDLAKIIYKDDDIYSAKYRKYTRYIYKDYASIYIEDYEFDCLNGPNKVNTSAYVFNTENGKLLSNSEILDIYNISIEKLKSIVKEKLDKEQIVIDEVEQIDITSTLNNLENPNNYSLYINKGGFLYLSYLVKNVKNDYNDVIILN